MADGHSWNSAQGGGDKVKVGMLIAKGATVVAQAIVAQATAPVGDDNANLASIVVWKGLVLV